MSRDASSSSSSSSDNNALSSSVVNDVSVMEFDFGWCHEYRYCWC